MGRRPSKIPRAASGPGEGKVVRSADLHWARMKVYNTSLIALQYHTCCKR
jgi:hypothetical protein